MLIKATFSGSLEWPLYTGLTVFLGSLEWSLYTGLTVFLGSLEPVYKGHSREPENVAFMSICPLYTG
jgi:hypothetical protein